jgi:hypothetical protein
MHTISAIEYLRDTQGRFVDQPPLPKDRKVRRAVMPAPMRRKGGTLLYAAYGSNLNIAAMAQRCPRAEPLYPLILDNAALVFRGVADMVHRKGSRCPLGIWSITRECEKALDRYEGVKGQNGMYVRRWFTLQMHNGLNRPVLFYQMRERGVCPPSVHYLQVIEQGYRDFGLDPAVLEVAVEEAWKERQVTPRIATRYYQKGRPEFGHTWDLDLEGG